MQYSQQIIVKRWIPILKDNTKMASDTDTIQIALKHHQAGQFQKAESIWLQILQGNLHHHQTSQK